MQLSIIVPSFNTREITCQCLDSLQKLNDFKLGLDFDVVIVDNASSDDSVTYIKSHYPQVKVVQNNANLGFSKANNIGIRESSNTPYVLFLNSDTVVPEGSLSRCINYMETHPEIGVLTCKVVLWSGLLDWDAHRGFPTPWVAVTRLLKLNKLFPQSKIFNQYNQGWKNMHEIHEIDSAVGAFMLTRRSVGELISWWDEEYFLNGEDIDFCFRVKERGYQVVYFPLAQITHYRGASKGTRNESVKVSKAKTEGKLRVANASVNAMEIFYRKHLSHKNPWITNVFVFSGLAILRFVRNWKVRIAQN